MANPGESVSHSESQSGSFIPEYSQTPILNEIAQHARSMSDQVYNWGMDRFNQNQGDIDGLMRDSLSYASPQRISVDMGQAEAGVQQAGERGRQSAIRDLESYGIDPSSGRYAALDQANRVMTAASAAGAGNQQRMADQAAGNAMRNQAIAAGLQNSQFGLGVGTQANQFLQTASSLKYPPLGQQSTSVSNSSSQQFAPQGGGGGGGGKSPEEKKPSQQGGGGGGGEGKAPSEKAAKPAKPAKPGKAPPKKDPEPKNKEDESDKGDLAQEGQRLSDEYDLAMEGQKLSDEFDAQQAREQVPGEEGRAGMVDRPTDPFEGEYGRRGMTSEEPVVDESAGLNTAAPVVDESAGLDTSGRPAPAAGGADTAAYDPYANQPVTTLDAQTAGYDPLTGERVDDHVAQDDTQTAGDTAGGLYTLASFTDGTPTSDGSWSDVGQGQTVDPYFQPSDQQGAYDATYDTGQFDTDPYFNPGDFQSQPDFGDTSYYEQQDPYFNPSDYQGDFGGTGDYSQDPYFNAGDQQGDYGNYTDPGYDYTDPGYDYTDPGYDNTSYDDTSYDDTSYDDTSYDDTSYDDTSYDDTSSDDNTDYGQYDAEALGLDESDYGARGGAVMQGRMAPGGRRARIMPPTGYHPRPRPRFARGGQVPGQGLPPPIPGQRRLDPPPQAPRPVRGTAMPVRGGPRPAPVGRGPLMPGNFISANGMPPPTGGIPQRMAQGGSAGRMAPPTTGGFVSRELSPSRGAQTDDVNARLNAGEFVIPKDIAAWKGKEFFYKLIAQARKQRNGGDQQQPQKPQTGYGQSRGMR